MSSSLALVNRVMLGAQFWHTVYSLPSTGLEKWPLAHSHIMRKTGTSGLYTLGLPHPFYYFFVKKI